MDKHSPKSFNYILIFLILLFSCFTSNAFALEQMRNSEISSDANWNTRNLTNTITYRAENGYYRLEYNTKNKTGSGMIYQALTVPAEVNARFSIIYQTYRSRNNAPTTYNFWARYGTSNRDNTGTNIVNDSTYQVTNGNGDNTASKTVTVEQTLNAGTYYVKAIVNITFGKNSAAAGAKIFDYKCNISPSGLTATSNINDSINLSWNTSTSDAVTLNKYYIYRSETSGSGYTKIGETNSGTTTYSDTNIVLGKTYYYVITDIDTANIESPYSKEATGKTPPPAVTLSGYLATDGWKRVELSWTPGITPNSGYNLYRSTTSGGPYTDLGNWGTDTTRQDGADSFTENNIYYYTVRYQSNGTWSAYSNEVPIFFLNPPTGLTAVYNFNVTNLSGSMALSWTPKTLTGLTGYQIYKSTTPDGTYTKVADIPSGTTTWTDNDVSSGETYYYKISCSTTKGTSSLSDYATGKDNPPRNLTGTVAGSTVNLNWQAPAPANATHGYYHVYRSVSATGPFTKLTSDWQVQGTTTTYTDSVTITDGDCYYYAVLDVDYNKVIISGFSNIAAVGNIARPTNLTASINANKDAVLNWTATTSATGKVKGYNIYRSTTNGSDYILIGSVDGANTTTYTDTTAKPDTTNYYVVTTCNNAGAESAYSNQANCTIPMIPAPSNLTAVIDGASVKLQWNSVTWPASKLTGYKIYRGTTSGGPYDSIGEVGGDMTTYNDYSALENTMYYYVVTAKDRTDTESAYSNEASGKVPTTISLTAHIDASILPEIVLTSGDIANIGLNWTINEILPGVTITGYSLGIIKSSGDTVQTDTAPAASTSGTVKNVILRNGESYLGYVEVFYSVGGVVKSSKFYTSESFSAVTPTTMVVRDGWSGADTAYTFFNNRIEANWDYDPSVSIIRYEVAVGTTPYSSNVCNWTDVGMVNRVAITTPELASGTRYYTSVRGLSLNKTQLSTGCSDGVIARKDAVITDTDASSFFNNARVLDCISTSNGKLTPISLSNSGGGVWKYCRKVTVTEPDVIDRVNAPCRISFTASPAPGNVREYRVTDDQGHELPRYNLSTTAGSPNIVFLINIKKGETRNYYVYWGNGSATEPNYGFTNNAEKNCLESWTPYYSRKDEAAGIEEVSTAKTHRLGGTSLVGDDNSWTNTQTLRQIGLSKFKFFGTDRSNVKWAIMVNGVIGQKASTAYTNYFSYFKNGSTFGYAIYPIWIDHRSNNSSDDSSGKAPADSGIFQDFRTNPNRILYTWVTNRYSLTEEIYRMQAVMYETGDVALAYKYVSPTGLFRVGGATGTDKPVNETEHTVGISNGDNSHWLINTPLTPGLNSNPTAFYQCMDAFEDTTTYGPITADSEAGHFESMIFDTKISLPEWDRIEYDMTQSGNTKLKISYRTGSTELPEMGGWSEWSTAVETTVSGNIPVSSSDKYLQYKIDFIKTGTGNISLDEVRLVYGGISIEQVASEIDGQPVTKVTQGQKSIPVTVSIKNKFELPVTLADSTDTATMTFSIGGHSARLNDTLPITIPAGQIATLSYLIDIADNAPTGECVIDALATATSGVISLSDTDAQIPLIWTVQSKSVIKIDKVYSDRTEVTKGQSGIPLGVYISNLGETDCIFDFATTSVSIGLYEFTLIGPATGSTIIPGKGSIIATFAVNIMKDSESGSDTINATASATNRLSGEKLEVIGSDNPHVWMIQNPADLVLTEIIASDTVYRGQKNNSIILRAQNMGEAEMEWNADLSEIEFIPHIGTYENLRKESAENTITLLGNEIADSLFKIDITEDTATGTDMIDGKLFGVEINTMSPLTYEDGSIVPGQWTIYAEKVNTYKDAGFSNESNSFNKPVGAASLSVYMKAENLSTNAEYRVHWYDPDGIEIVQSEPRSGDAGSNVYHEYSFSSSAKNGIYKVTITNALNTYICCQNTFELVSPAAMLASFTLPAYVTVGQTFNASFTYINEGGAVIESATLGTASKSGTGGINIVTADGSQFTPKFAEVPGFGQATATYSIEATGAGNIRLTNTATGIDANSGKSLTSGAITSNQCVIQSPPNISITLNNLPATQVYLNQKNLIVTATFKNNGEATAIINTASMTFSLGSYNQEVTSPAIPFEIAGGSSITVTYNLSVLQNSDSGTSNLTVESEWIDKNWVESGIKNSTSNQKSWTIVPYGLKLASDPDFAYEQADFCPGQTVYVKAYGLNPNSTYYRIRIYNSKVNQTTTAVPTTQLVKSPMLQASGLGEVDFYYELPANAAKGVWSATLEFSGETGNVTNGNMWCLQYFNVQGLPTLSATINIDTSKDIFVGDTFNVSMTVTSTEPSSSAVDDIFPYTLLKSGTAQGNAIQISGPEPATFTLRAGESKTFDYVFKATEHTGETSTAGNRFILTTTGVAAEGTDRNLWNSVTAPVVVSNGLIIYSKAIGVTPNPLSFGTLVCGEIETASDFTVQKLGNYPAKNIRLNAADFNGPVIDGTMARISKAYFTINPEQIDNLDSDKTIEVHINVPYNQQAGSYSTTMFVYSDENGNGVFDSGEITAEFKASVSIDSCWLLKVVDKYTDMGDWPKGVEGTITEACNVSFFNAGNMPLYNVKVKALPEASATFNFLLSETNVGPLPIGESHTIQVSADTRGGSPEPVSGTYIATFTVWEDNNNDGYIQPSEPKDTFQVKISIGEMGYTISPISVQASPVDPSRTAYSGVLPGFDELTIRNTGELALTRIKLQAGDGSSTAISDGHGHYLESGNVIIAPSTLKTKIEKNESDNFALAVFIPAGTYSATYTTTLHFYSDDNRNGIMDTQEYHKDVEFKVYVTQAKKLQVVQKTVTLGGVMSSPDDAVQKIQTFSCRNIGNIELTNLFIKPEQLVHQVNDTLVLPAACASFPPTDFFECEGVGNFFYPTILMTVPANTTDGIYVTTVDCRIFEDENRNKAWDAGEAYDTFKIMIEVGRLSIAVDKTELKVNGEPFSLSTKDTIYVTNTGSLDVTNVNGTATVLIGPASREIPATASVFTPKNAGTLIGGQSKSMSWAVNIPENTPVGTYTGQITLWGDSNNNGKIDSGEPIATATCKLYVKNAMKLDIVGDNLEIGETLTSLTTVRGSTEIRSTGNGPVTDLKTILSDLKLGSSIIASDCITCELQSTSIDAEGSILATYTVAVGSEILATGIYSGEQKVYADLNHNDQWDPDEPYDTVILKVIVGQKELEVTPNPLDFGHLGAGFTDSKTVSAKNTGSANLRRIRAVCDSHCTCGCTDTTISVSSPTGSVNIRTSNKYDFVFDINVGLTTKSGQHSEKWRFFDDDNNNGVWDEAANEYSVVLDVLYYIDPIIKVSLTPASHTVALSKNSVATVTYTLTNLSNTELDTSNLTWSWNNLYKDSSNYLSSLSTISVISMFPAQMLGIGSSTTCSVQIRVGEVEEGVYSTSIGPASSHELRYMTSTVLALADMKITVGNDGPTVPSDCVYQQIASSTFEDCNVATVSYFLSAWVCTTNDEPAIGELSLVRYGSDGRPKSAVTVCIDNERLQADAPLTITNPMVFLDGSEAYPVDGKLYYNPDVSSPVGICGAPITATEGNGTGARQLQFFRIYVNFKVGIDTDTDECNDTFRIVLSQRPGATNTRPTKVYFDGIKLEKSFAPDQEKPTTYHQGATLFSPSYKLDMGGRHQYYEW